MKNFYDEHFARLARSQSASSLSQVGHFLARILELKPESQVLDIGCGLGQIALELASQGYTLTGIDLCEPYVREACEQAKIRQLPARFIAGDARYTQPDQPQDAAFFWHTSFGHFSSDTDNLALLQSAFRALKPGGRLLLDYPNFYQTLSQFQPDFTQHYDTAEGPLTVCRHSRLEPEAGLLSQDWEFIYATGERALRQGSLKIYLPDRLLSLLNEAGFDLLTSYGDLLGSEFNLNTSRWIGVLRRRAK